MRLQSTLTTRLPRLTTRLPRPPTTARAAGGGEEEQRGWVLQLATAHLFAERGASVTILDPIQPPKGSTACGVARMCATPRQIRQAVDRAAGKLGGLDIVVNNAGIGAQGTVEDNDDEEWPEVYELNVLGVVRAARAALPHVRQSSWTSLVNVSSIAATAGLPNRALYSAS